MGELEVGREWVGRGRVDRHKSLSASRMYHYSEFDSICHLLNNQRSRSTLGVSMAQLMLPDGDFMHLFILKCLGASVCVFVRVYVCMSVYVCVCVRSFVRMRVSVCLCVHARV